MRGGHNLKSSGGDCVKDGRSGMTIATEVCKIAASIGGKHS